MPSTSPASQSPSAGPGPARLEWSATITPRIRGASLGAYGDEGLGASGSPIPPGPVGGVALIFHSWWLWWTCVAVVVLSIPAGKWIRIMDDTVS